MKKLYWILVLLFPVITIAQGIRFEQGLTWDQLKKKAQRENKYIFADCAASWCVPCKKMEKEVFPLRNVGDFMNQRFISVHVQMDTSKKDDENIKANYSDAHALKEQYKVRAFPTYLFFSPEGKIVHRYLQALPDTLFLKVAANALNPKKQYYTLLDEYNRGKKDFDRLNFLATLSGLIGEDSVANAIASDYLHNYLNKLSEKDLLHKKYLDFIKSFAQVLSSKDNAFRLVYKRGNDVDRILCQTGFSQATVTSVIKRELIDPKLWPNGKTVNNLPDWETLNNTIGRKFNKFYTGLSISNAQIMWYREKRDIPQIIKYTVKRYDTYGVGVDTAGIGWALINNTVFNLVFKNCNNPDTLLKAIRWMEVIIDNHPDDFVSMDTKANLLYKVGRAQDAIALEEKAKELEEAAAKNEKRSVDIGYADTLDKMRKGLPTWL